MNQSPTKKYISWEQVRAMFREVTKRQADLPQYINPISAIVSLRVSSYKQGDDLSNLHT